MTDPLSLEETSRSLRVKPRIFQSRHFWYLLSLAIITIMVYLPGLDGPFLFDDPPNIILPFKAWLSGQTGWQELVFGNRSGILGRPLSMLTFVANASISGLDVVPFKATNLAIHILCGLVIYLLLSRLLARDARLSPRAKLTAVLIAAVWLLHPMQVSTVLYVVQRMAQLSTLFMLVAVFAYVLARTALETGRSRAGLVWLFVGVPAATAAAMLSKENGALVPLLCAVVELGYFRSTTFHARPRSVKAFFAFFLVIPGLLAAAVLAFKPHRLLGGYESRTFTLAERLMSEPRAIFDYIGALLVPRGPALGVYTDDFVVSRGLLDPPTTLIAIIGLAVLLGLTWRARNTIPALFTGIGLYLGAHVMESTIFPLELYFEHRNYLPSVGLFLALAGLLAWGVDKLPAANEQPRLRPLLRFGMAAMLILLSAATFARATIWSSWPVLAEQGMQQHPQSMRAHLDHASLLLAQSKNDEAAQVFERIRAIDNPAARHVGDIYSVFMACLQNRDEVSPRSLVRIASMEGATIQLAEMLAFERLADYLHKHECKGLRKEQLAEIVSDIVNASPQPATRTEIWRLRFVAARLFLAGGQPRLAQEQASLAWMSGTADTSVGIHLANIFYLNGEKVSAQIILDDARRKTASWDRRNQLRAEQLARVLNDSAGNSAPVAPLGAPAQ